MLNYGAGRVVVVECCVARGRGLLEQGVLGGEEGKPSLRTAQAYLI